MKIPEQPLSLEDLVFGIRLMPLATIHDDGTIEGPVFLCGGHVLELLAVRRELVIRFVVRGDIVEAVKKIESQRREKETCSRCRQGKQQMPACIPPLQIEDLAEPQPEAEA